MGRMKKIAGLLSLTALLTIAMSVPAFAAKKIKEVSISVSDEFKIGEDCSTEDVEVTSKSKKYTVGDVEILNEINEWGPSDVPELEVTLNAEDGYYFSISAATINVKGGTYVSGRKGDSNYSVILKLRLPALTNQVGTVEEAGWSSKNVASWKETYNAGSYEVTLYHDGKKYGTIQSAVGTTFDFAPFMKKAGTYTYKVRGVNTADSKIKGDWFESQSGSYIDEATAESYRTQYGSAIPTGITEPDQQIPQSSNGTGWQKDNKGWWYRNADGTYPTNNWQQVNGSYPKNDWQRIDGKWYYFDSVGYMVTGWIEWNGKYYYCRPVDGDMLVDTVVPDGSGRRVDSAGAWIQ